MRIQYVIILSLLIFLSTVGFAHGQMMNQNIGVQNGNTFFYSYTCYYDSDDASFVMPANFAWINQTDHYMMTVTGISGQEINYNTNMQFFNGTIIYGNGYMNMQDGINHMMSGYNPMGTFSGDYFFMASNVGMMGRMFPYASNSPTVSDTVVRSYPDGERTLNHIYYANDQDGVMNQNDYYFDQETGAMVEWRQQYIQTNGNLQANSTQLMQLTNSSVWTVPEFSTFIIIPLICVITALALFIKIKSKPADSSL